jgi:glucosyl-dolichyl phosphate glucuronosyltransferase
MIRHGSTATFGPLRCLGYTPGGDTITLFFTPLSGVKRNLLMFFHLYPESREVLPDSRTPFGYFNCDHVPLIPTIFWRKGIVYPERVLLEGVPAGRYHARFGLYDEEKAATIPREQGGGDAVDIMGLEVSAGAAGGRSAPAVVSAPTRFSVILCTHNRAGYLKKAVESLFRLDYPAGRFEIIVVDNRSADATPETAAALRKDSPVPMGYYREPRLGLSHARNTGIGHSRHEVVAYLDDDAAADARWLAVFDETLRSLGADVVGGKVVPTPVDGFTPPGWFYSDYVWGFYGLDWEKYGCPGRIVRIEFPRYLGGGNSCYRKELLRLPWARFHGKLGRTGNKLYQGEETLLNFFLAKNGCRIYYNADAVIQHFVDPERVTKRFVARKALWGGYSDALMHREMFGRRFVFSRGPAKFREALSAYREARRSGADENAAFEKKCLLLHDTGYLLRILKFWELR